MTGSGQATPERRQIPMSAPDIGRAEREAVAAVMRTPRLSMGPEVESFEGRIRDFTGARHAIAVSSGTTGLHLCVCASDIADMDLVITTPFSFVSSANVLLYERATPVFVDVDPVTGNIDPRLVAQAVQDLKQGGKPAGRWLPRRGSTPETALKGILSVDVFGQPADYDALRDITEGADLILIEDSCEALGASYHSQPAGMLGDVGVFAFYPNKQVTTAEGGMVVTDDDQLAERIRAMRNQGRAPGDTWLDHTYLGYNYRLDELSAALGRVQMTRLAELLEKRDQVAGWYAERLAEIPAIETPHVVPSTSRMSWFVYVVRLPEGTDRTALSERLEARGVPPRPYFRPIHLQAYFRERFDYRPGDFPVTEDLGQRSLALPFSGVLSEEEVEYVCSELQSALQHTG
ncbi:MAG: DegT/DnrJ/EryC1/StrS family aminotransferase [Anaerolineales bacterium]